jgi:hypothetical protein
VNDAPTAEPKHQLDSDPAIVITIPRAVHVQVTFDRRELSQILNIYGRMVVAGEWRDYAMDFLRDRAVFSIFRRTSEVPLFTVVKDPARARKQGMYAVINAQGAVLKRGHELAQVLKVFDKKMLKLV